MKAKGDRWIREGTGRGRSRQLSGDEIDETGFQKAHPTACQLNEHTEEERHFPPKRIDLGQHSSNLL